MNTPLPVPAGPGDVTASWLSAVLACPVAAADVIPVGTGQTGATYRVALRYDDPALDAPATVIVKLSSQDPEVRQRVALGYAAEHAFYQHVANTVAVPLPTVYHCAIANGGADFVLVMADQAPAVQGDQMAGCERAAARVAVQALAGLHGPRWCDPAWLDFPAATMPMADAGFAAGMGQIARSALDITVQRLGSRLDPADRDTLQSVGDVVEPWLLTAQERYCLLHGDFRCDNLLFDPTTGAVTVVDWQTLSVGLPARDLAYFLATSLLPGCRREHERDLVAAYHAALITHGVAGYSFAQCWSDYRLGMLQAPLLTALGFAYAAVTERGDTMVLTMLARGAQAIRHHDTLQLIGELN